MSKIIRAGYQPRQYRYQAVEKEARDRATIAARCPILARRMLKPVELRSPRSSWVRE